MSSSNTLLRYQELIDAFVERNDCVLARRVRKGQLWPTDIKHAGFNDLVASLSQEQRAVLADFLQCARESGIHDALAILSELMNLKGFSLAQGGEAIPHEPYGTELHFDWAARLAGEEWPSRAG